MVNTCRKQARESFQKQSFNDCLQWLEKMPEGIESLAERSYRHRVTSSCFLALGKADDAKRYSETACLEDPCIQSSFINFQAALRCDRTPESEYEKVSA